MRPLDRIFTAWSKARWIHARTWLEVKWTGRPRTTRFKCRASLGLAVAWESDRFREANVDSWGGGEFTGCEIWVRSVTACTANDPYFHGRTSRTACSREYGNALVAREDNPQLCRDVGSSIGGEYVEKSLPSWSDAGLNLCFGESFCRDQPFAPTWHAHLQAESVTVSKSQAVYPLEKTQQRSDAQRVRQVADRVWIDRTKSTCGLSWSSFLRITPHFTACDRERWWDSFDG